MTRRSPSPPDASATVQIALARALLEGAAASGVRELVVSPGARSTPLVLAALELPELRLHDVVDERSAAFFALGLARASGRPAAVLCTSGSAGAHYFPAVLEAEAAYLPLVVLTADRPHERQDCAASQTTDQLGLYGRHVRAFFDLPVAEPRERVARAARRIGAQAAARAQWPTPGPVHVNVRARKPLEPAAASDRSGGSHLASRAGESAPQRGAPLLPRPLVVPDETAVLELVERCARAERPLVVCGPGPLARAGEERTALLALLRRLGFPVFAEVTSQLRLVDAEAGAGIAWCDELAVVLDAPPARQGLRPDLVLQIGAPPVSAGFEELLEGGWVREHLVVAEHGHPDPVSTATLVVQAPLAATARAWLGALETRPSAPPAPAWLGTVRAWCAAARAAIEDVLRAAPAAPGSDSATRGDAMGEGALARAVVEALPPGALLALGNSLPIRSAEIFAPPRNRPLRVWSQRGLAGIDGLVSGVAGTLAAPGREPAPPAAAALLVGDLGFLHDLGGLATLRGVETPFAVVVVQNRGGRIFEQLPLAAGTLAGALPHFVMSQDLDVVSAAAAFGLPCARVADRAQLDAALRSAFTRGGATVIEALVPEHAAAAERAALRRAMASAAVVSPPGVESEP